MPQKLIYVAGPLFSEVERAYIEKIAALCETLGFRTYVPHRDAGLQTKDNGNDLYAADCKALNEAAFVVANLDGVDIDSGTAWEIGWFVRGGGQALGVRTDRRILEPWSRINLMIEKSTHVVDSFDGLRALLLVLATK